MSESAESDLVARFWTAVDLADLGIEIKRQNLRRAHPAATDDEIEKALAGWLQRRGPDAPGRSRPLTTP